MWTNQLMDKYIAQFVISYRPYIIKGIRSQAN